VELKVFRVTAKRCLETSTPADFLTTRGTDEAVFWVDVSDPQVSRVSEFLSPLGLHPLVGEGCVTIRRVDRVCSAS
jgi:Mg2+ and Co2+ transporter CorA